MLCEFYVLSQSENGKIIKCSKCEHKLALMYNNISQSYSISEFLEFKKAIDTLKEEIYFTNYPDEDKIHIRTGVSGLFFSFRKEEIAELRKLFANAWFQYKLIEDSQNNLN